MGIHSVLVVDNSYVNRNLVKTILKEAGHYIIGEAPDGEDAIKLIPELKPSVITLDLNMEKVSGYEVLEFVKEKYPLLPVIVVTGDRKIENQERALQLGADYLVKKPFQPAFLLSRLDEIEVISTIYDVEEKEEEVIEFNLASKAIERPERPPENFKIHNQSTQIVFDDEIANDKEKFALRETTVVAQMDEDDDLLDKPTTNNTISHTTKGKIVTVIPETSISETNSTIANDAQNITHESDSPSDKDKDLEEISSKLTANNSTNAHVDNSHRSLPEDKCITEPSTEESICYPNDSIETNNKNVASDNMHPIYNKELFVVYDEDPIEQKNVSEAITERSPTTQTVKEQSVEERLNRNIRPPMRSRRPLTPSEKERFETVDGDFIIRNEDEPNAASDKNSKKRKGFFSNLFKNKKN